VEKCVRLPLLEQVGESEIVSYFVREYRGMGMGEIRGFDIVLCIDLMVWQAGVDVRSEPPSYFGVERSLDYRRRSNFDVLSRLSGVYLLFLFILSHFINLISHRLNVCKSRSQIAHAPSVLVVKAHLESTKQVARKAAVWQVYERRRE
jgi:hypothetical protein